MFKVLLFIFITLLTSCGYELDSSEAVIEETSVNQEVLANSYMVAFRSDKLFRHVNYLREYSHANTEILFHLRNDADIKDIYYYGSYDLAQDFKVFSSLPHNFHFGENDVAFAPSIIARVDFHSSENVESILNDWLSQGIAYFVEANGISYLSQEESMWGGLRSQYGERSLDAVHTAIDTLSAFQSLAAKNPEDYSPIIAVMDSGIDVQHPAIKDRIWLNDAIGQAGCGNDDYYGCNTTVPKAGSIGNGDVAPYGASGHNTPCPSGPGGSCESTCCHGTHVAGIIAGDITAGVAGVCPRCQIMVLRIVGSSPAVGQEKTSGVILDSSIAGALRYIASFRNSYGKAVRVINASFGKFHRSKSISVLVRGIANTPRNSGALIIGASGNEDSNRIQYPAGFDDAIAVANLNFASKTTPMESAHKNPTSNFGRWVDIAAPGTNISSCVPGTTSPELKTGTSMAAPVVAGIAGLVLVANPNISLSDLRDALIQSADPRIYDSELNQNYLARIPGERSTIPLLGSGMVHAQRAVDQQATEGRPLILGLDRVERGCGVVTGSNKALGFVVCLLLFLFPLLILNVPTIFKGFRK